MSQEVRAIIIQKLGLFFYEGSETLHYVVEAVQSNFSKIEDGPSIIGGKIERFISSDKSEKLLTTNDL